ncbi:MAG: SprT family zinc-dependent metalloprotease [Rhizobiaceae bacterium]
MFGLSRAKRAPTTVRHDGGSLEIAGRVMPLAIVEHARARRLTLRIETGGRGIRVTVPPGVDRDEIDRFVRRHHGWLSERVERLPDRQALKPGMKVPVRGEPHRIVHVEGKRGITATARQADGPVLLVYGDPRHVGRRVADFLKKQAKAHIEPLVVRHASAIGAHARSVRFKDTASRWGSCSAAGNLSFSWRIMMAPPAVIDYLVAHEVAHLKEMNHGAGFWRLCEKLCPKTAECRAWLKRNGAKLQAIPF